MLITWLAGLLRRRGARLAATATGVAVAVALLASLGAFLAAAQSTMTDRAVRSVAVDWQVQVQPGSDAAAVANTVRGAPYVRSAKPVGFATTSGLSATGGGSTETTGPGVVLGLPPGYRTTFPGEVRQLTGGGSGALLAQQTAANLHAKLGDTVTVGRAGLPPVLVRVAGVVALPHANSLFQKVGAPKGSQPSAPPDNVILLPASQWHTLFNPLAAARPDLVSTQIHTSLKRRLPPGPSAAYSQVTAAAHNLEVRSTGGAVVGNNLGAALDAARSDAAYARVLFLFLGLPGAVLAGLLTAAVAAAAGTRRRREQALLRARGASGRRVVGLAALEAAAVGVSGSLVGLGVAALIGQLAFGSAQFGATPAVAAGWAAAAAVVGLLIAATSVLLPAYRDLRGATVNAGRTTMLRPRAPVWARYGLDFALLIAAGLVFWVTSRTGYQLVLAPEGVPKISVSYWAFAGPALLWAGSALLVWRVADLVLGHGKRTVGKGLRPLAGGLAQIVASSMSRQRRVLARSIVLLGLAVAFAASTATFNATYRAQAEADAQLTNGADVTVTESPGVHVPPSAAANLSTVPGVRGVEPVQHRFAYVGADLQDLYGVRPSTIRNVTALQDSYFKGGTAKQLMATLAAKPDSILVSAETVKDFQLHPGDLLRLRLQNSRTKQFTTVPFHYVGIVAEFPTAPKDSFLVANASYIAQRTGSDAVGSFLVNTGGQNSSAVAHNIQHLLGPSAAVTSLAHSRKVVGSSLTAVDLSGLTSVELGFAVALAAAAGALVLALGLAERRRSFAIAAALGASRRQLRGFVVGEAVVLAVGGLAAGALSGWALSHMLVSVLTGVFDPPPDALAVPWAYLAGVGVIILVSLAVVCAGTVRSSHRPPLRVLREL
ncbi:MAG: ABC transporter permease [Sciscionella sp.]